MTSPAPRPRMDKVHALHSSVEYAGESIWALRWDDAFPEQLRGDTYFWAVFLKEWPRSSSEPVPLRGACIAVCSLGQAPGQAVEQASREVRVVREAQARLLAETGETKAARHGVESLGGYVHEALSEQNQRLSSWVVQRLVRGEQSEQTDPFIKMVQVSDLSGLAHVLDNELAWFIGDLLRSSES